MPPLPRSLFICTAFALASCAACQSPVELPESTLPGKCQSDQPLIEPQKLDILFVIDNSGSMKEEQESVARELVAFVDELRSGGGVSQDFNIGVVTTSVYQHTLVNGVRGYREYPEHAGRLQPVPDSDGDGGVKLGTGTERLLSGEDPQLIDKFSRLVRVGTQGSGQETPFEAARLALTGDLIAKPISEGGNGGLLRDRARLLVVVVTDEEDCSEQTRPPHVYVGTDYSRDLCTEQSSSLGTVASYYDLFSNLTDGTGAKRDIVWAVIGPVGVSTKQAQLVVVDQQARNVDCPTSFGPGMRHRQMAEMFNASLANLDSICKSSYRDTLINIAGLAKISQTISVKQVPDPKMLQIDIVRRDGTKKRCTLLNEGISRFDPPAGEEPGRVHFGGECQRRADDQAIEIRMLCAS